MTEVMDLRRYKIFSSFSDKQLSEVAKIAEKRAYRKHAHVYERGDRATHVFLLSKGLVSLRDIGTGDLVGIAYQTCDPGEFFGGAALVGGPEYLLTAVCLEASEVVAIDSKRLFQLCENDLKLAYNLMLTTARLYFDRYKNAKKQVYEMLKTPTVITALPG